MTRVGKKISDNSRGHVLVVGDDMRIFLAVVRSLGRAGYTVHAAPFDWQAPALRSRFISATHRLPRYSDSPKDWLAGMKEVVAENRIVLIIPCCDRAILPLARHRTEFGTATLAIPGAEALETLFDKGRTKSLAETLGIPVSDWQQLLPTDAAADLAARFGLPVVVKPKRSYSIDRLTTWGKVHICETLVELTNILASIDEPERYLVEQYFKGGVGVGVSVLAAKGRIVQAFQHKRLREGWGGSSSYRISETCDPQLLDAARLVCASMCIHGVCMFEFRRNQAGGNWILLEVNARLWGSLPLSLGMGLDFPLALCELHLSGTVAPARPYRAGVRSRNALLDGFNLLSATRRRRLGGVRAGIAAWADYLAQPIWWISGREHSDSFTPDDPAPGFAEVWHLAGRLARPGHAKQKRRPGDRTPAADYSIAKFNAPR